MLRNYLNHITTAENVIKNTRPISVEDERIFPYIIESEAFIIKSIGDEMLIDLLEYLNPPIPDDEDEEVELEPYPNAENYIKLLNGEVYEYKGVKYLFEGLINCLNYFVYAKVVQHNDNNITRFGFVQKEDEYSSRPNFQQKLAEIKEAYSIAETYLKTVVDYLDRNKENFPLYKLGEKEKRSVIITKIGD